MSYKHHWNHINYLKLAPIDRIIDEPYDNSKKRITAYGYSFIVPWDGNVERIEAAMATVGVLHDRKIVFSITNPEEVYISHFQQNRVNDSDDFDKKFAEFYKNDFEYIKDSLFSTISPMCIFQSVFKAKMQYYKLFDKSFRISSYNDLPGKIYFYDMIDYKVFQVGDPAVNKIIKILAFPEMDKEVEVLILSRDHKIEQQDIDVIILSFRKDS